MLNKIFGLHGKNALITGASKGLGKQVAYALASAGANVSLHARNYDDLLKVQEEVSQFNIKTNIYQTDMLDSDSISKNVTRTIEDFGSIDILVNNAGVNIRKPVLEMSQEDWDFVLNTNLKGYFLMSQQVAPYMINQSSGKIINMASILGSVALSSQAAYASSKGGIIQLTKVMALEWAQNGIQVNAIAPTYFETPLVSQIRNDPDKYNFINERTPMGRWGQPEELSGTAIFLASKASDFITGQTIHVDGGWTIW